jgi:hypothetical protein
MLERGAIQCDTQVPTLVDSLTANGEQAGCERQRVTYAQSELHMELAGKGQMNERRMRDATGDTASCEDDTRNLVVREDVVDPLWCGINRKRCNRNVVDTHSNIPIY